MQYSSIFWWTVLWLIFWGVAGGIITRRIYLRKDLDTSNATLGGSVIGAAFGPVGLVPLWWMFVLTESNQDWLEMWTLCR